MPSNLVGTITIPPVVRLATAGGDYRFVNLMFMKALMLSEKTAVMEMADGTEYTLTQPQVKAVLMALYGKSEES